MLRLQYQHLGKQQPNNAFYVPCFNDGAVVLCVRWQGLSFLDLRYHLLLFYLQDLTHLISIKAEGGRIGESEALSRVLGVRTVR